jgi:hypothetical protein
MDQPTTKQPLDPLTFDDEGYLTFSPHDSDNPQNFSYGRKCKASATSYMSPRKQLV